MTDQQVLALGALIIAAAHFVRDGAGIMFVMWIFAAIFCLWIGRRIAALTAGDRT